MSLLEVSHLKKSFGDLVAVDDVNFSIEAGEIFGLLGPNGAGKSTTMNMICGLLEPDSGTIKINGNDMTYSNQSARVALGVVPQDLAIYPDLTAYENLTFFGRLYGIERSVLTPRIDAALEQVGLTSRAKDLAGEYSGGMKRRLNFAIALLHEPQLLILDEPTVGVDPQSRFHLMECIQDLNAKGVSAIYCSHYMEEVETLCKRVAIIDHGKMKACDSIENLLNQLDAFISLRLKDVSEKLKSMLLQQPAISQPNEQTETANEPSELTFILTRHHQSKSESNKQLADTLQQIEQQGAHLISIETNEPNLERLFLKITGHTLRD